MALIPTERFEIGDSYTEHSVSKNAQIIIQNVSSTPVELFITDNLVSPTETSIGFILEPFQYLPQALTLDTNGRVFARTYGEVSKAIIVAARVS